MRRTVTLLVLLVAAWWPAVAQAQDFPLKPGERDFVVDDAEMIDATTEAAIVGRCDKLLSEKVIPILVVTIPSLAAMDADRWSIERYARALFNEWGIGEKQHNRGILLLVSPGDRKARIELGADWGGGKHRDSQDVMDALIIPRFKAGDFTGGIEAGVAGLDAMAREIPVPSRYRAKTPAWVYLMWIAFIGLAIFTAISLYRRGASGWAWLAWGAVFTLAFLLLRGLAESRRSGGGGSFGGGSFGGGFSGGGGASGSW